MFPNINVDKIWNDVQAADMDNPGTLVNASLHQKEFQKIPKCVRGFEIHKLDAGKSDRISYYLNWLLDTSGILSLDGKVSVARYEKEFSSENFCIDR